MKKIYYKVSVPDKINMSKKKVNELDKFINLCEKYGLEIVDCNDISQDVLKIEFNDNCFVVNGKVFLSLDEVFNLKILGSKLFVNNPRSDELKIEIARLELTQSKLQNKYKTIYNKKLNKFLYLYKDINNCCDYYTGSFFFYDYEWELVRNDELGLLFGEKNSFKSYKYILPLDDKILLRGSDVYYYFSCYQIKGIPANKSEINLWFNNVKSFLDKSMNILKNYRVNNSLSLRLILALIDNIRNILLIIINGNTICNLEQYDNCTYIQQIDKTREEYKSFLLYKELYEIILFHNINYEEFSNTYIIKLISLIEITDNMFNKYQKRIMDVNNNYVIQKCFNPLRESDNFFENYFSTRETAKTISKKAMKKRKINLFSLLCGGSELALLLSSFITNLENNLFFVIQSYGMYFEKTIIDLNFSHEKTITNFDVNKVNGNYNLLVDENIMTSKSMQLFINDQLDNGISFDGLFILKFPNIGRIPQIIHQKIGVNLALFDKFIFGFLSSSSYTNIETVKINKDEYQFIDEFGFFSIPTEIFLKGIYKNNSFIEGSEADVFNIKYNLKKGIKL